MAMAPLPRFTYVQASFLAEADKKKKEDSRVALENRTQQCANEYA